MERISGSTGMEVIYPVHPRAKKRMEEYGVVSGSVRTIEPVGYLDFLQLESNARLVLTDSGGVQEESCILKVPCVTMRDSTERPETVMVGANILSGTDPQRIEDACLTMLGRRKDWENPFGDGKAAVRIIDIASS